MFDYFLRVYDMKWFDAPKRPLPPLYTRPTNSRDIPTSKSPIGEIAPDCELTKLTDYQLAMWRAA